MTEMPLVIRAVWSLWFMAEQTAILVVPVVAVIGFFSWRAWPRAGGDQRRLLRLFWLLPPIIFIAVWTGIFWADGHQPDRGGLGYGIGIPLLSEIAIAVTLCITLRGLRLWAVMYGLFGVFVAALFAFIGAMAMTGEWI